MYLHLFAGIEINPNLIAILVTYFIAMISIVMMSIILMKHYRLQQDKLSELANAPYKICTERFYYSNLKYSKSKLLPGRKANETFCLPLIPEISKLLCA